jgi:uncharacterized protein
LTITDERQTALQQANQTELLAKESALVDAVQAAGSLIVAYSGGVDSSLLAYYARKTLGGGAKIVIAISPSLAEEELQAARAQARQFDWNLIEIGTTEVDRADYQRNDAMRCYFCKSTLFEELDKMSAQLGIAHVAYGANMDDLSDFRPGHKAAREHQVLSPLQTAQLNKSEIRELAKVAGLPSWDRPQAACLSSRFPTFETVNAPALSRVDAAERFIHSLGFKQVRVRNHTISGTAGGAAAVLLARIEVEQSEMDRFSNDLTLFDRINTSLQELGYAFVTLDLAGYQQGSTNITSLKSPAAKDKGD